MKLRSKEDYSSLIRHKDTRSYPSVRLLFLQVRRVGDINFFLAFVWNFLAPIAR